MERRSHEQTGLFRNAVLTEGHVVDGDTVRPFYGASDRIVCGVRLSLQEIHQSLRFAAV